MSVKFRFVCATRESEEQFHQKTATGRSLRLYPYPFAELRLFASNTSGLPLVYNAAIREAAHNPAVLIFVHDDVHLCDFFWPRHMADALSRFNVAGVAGNKRRLPRQAAWPFVDDKYTWDAPENLSGIVAHGKGFPPIKVDIYGLPYQAVKLLDGVMLIANSALLLQRQLLFDERFDFHFYDMDFCRQAELLGVSLGTCGVSIVHESIGNFAADAWRAAYARYLEKWGE